MYEYDDMDIVTMTQSPSYDPSHHEPREHDGEWTLDEMCHLLTDNIGVTDRTMFVGAAPDEDVVNLAMRGDRHSGPYTSGRRRVFGRQLRLALRDCLTQYPDAVWYDRDDCSWVIDSATADAIMRAVTGNERCST
jgi:hypothetical protein